MQMQREHANTREHTCRRRAHALMTIYVHGCSRSDLRTHIVACVLFCELSVGQRQTHLERVDDAAAVFIHGWGRTVYGRDARSIMTSFVAHAAATRRARGSRPTQIDRGARARAIRRHVRRANSSGRSGGEVYFRSPTSGMRDFTFTLELCAL